MGHGATGGDRRGNHTHRLKSPFTLYTLEPSDIAPIFFPRSTSVKTSVLFRSLCPPYWLSGPSSNSHEYVEDNLCVSGFSRKLCVLCNVREFVGEC